MQAITSAAFFNSGEQQSRQALVDRKESDSDSSFYYVASVLSNGKSDSSFSWVKEDDKCTSVKGIIDPVLGCTFEEEELENTIHPISPAESFYVGFHPTLSPIPEECESSMIESDYNCSVESNLSANKVSDACMAVSVSTEKRSHKRRTQAWNRLTRLWHRKNSNVDIEDKEKSSCENSGVKDKNVSVSSSAKVDVENDDNQSIISDSSCDLESLRELTPVSSIDMFEHLDCLSSNASSLASSAEYSLGNCTVEAEEPSSSTSSSLVAEQNDDDYSPSISSSLVAGDHEAICSSNIINLADVAYSSDGDNDDDSSEDYSSEDDDSYSLSISSSLVAEQDDNETIYSSNKIYSIGAGSSSDDDIIEDDGYSPSISSSLVVEEYDTEIVYFPNKGPVIIVDWQTAEILQANGGRIRKASLFGSCDDLVNDPDYATFANSSILREIKINYNILKN
ncbi:unnamed protein product [Ambrosiozyma monospora]|uniref:Unnamed protein product n=1 Tax=Ambrosiozyma monospora TaxID=43982 RepID=A0ACB5T2L7_AMBMO|nr:unnamed protein product [Ambrosiozyma monospora]